MGDERGMSEIIFNYLIPFLIMVNVVVFIHSAGHFISARVLEINVTEVSIGLGPKLFAISQNSMSWKICWLPIGGYVQTRTKHDDEGSYGRKISVALSGPAFSLLFSLVIFFLLFTIKGAPVVQDGKVLLVPQSFADGIAAMARSMVWTWTVWDTDQSSALAMVYDSPAARLICLAAIWSSKFGILNLLPLPKFDGLKTIELLLISIAGPNHVDKIMGWGLRLVFLLAVLGVGFVTWNDIMELKVFEFFQS